MRLGLVGVLLVISTWSSAGWSRPPARTQEHEVKTHSAGNVAFDAQPNDITVASTEPANQTMEVYRLDQADGSVIALDFARADAFAATTAEALFADVAG